MATMAERRLKLRFRVLGSSVRGKVDVAASCTVREVKAHICSTVAGLDATDVSLDKKVGLNSRTLLLPNRSVRAMACCWSEMRSPAEQTVLGEADALAATGICSGDLLWVHINSPMDVAPPAAASSLATSMPPCPALPAEKSAAVQQQPQAQLVPATEQGVAKRQKAADAAPVSLESSPVPAASPLCMPAGATANCGSILQMVAALHAVLLDSGLAAANDVISAQVGLPSTSTVCFTFQMARIYHSFPCMNLTHYVDISPPCCAGLRAAHLSAAIKQYRHPEV